MLVNYLQLKKDFIKLAESNRLSHAYLFFGGVKSDKFIFAQSLANFLENNIFEPSRKILKETLIISADEKKTIGIDKIRFLKSFLWQKPTTANLRTAIIYQAENLTPEAQNAALKIVEEPPESILIIFISGSEEDLPPTLSSRLQKIYFPYRLATNLGQPAKSEFSLEDIVADNDHLDKFFESLIADLSKDSVKNVRQLKEILNRLVLIKQFNTNKRLQLKAILAEKEYG